MSYMNGEAFPPFAASWLPSNSCPISARRLGDGDICCCSRVALRDILATGMPLERPNAMLHRFSIIKAAKGVELWPPHLSLSAAKRRERSVLGMVRLLLLLDDVVVAEKLAVALLTGRSRPLSSSSSSLSPPGTGMLCGCEGGAWGVGR